MRTIFTPIQDGLEQRAETLRIADTLAIHPMHVVGCLSSVWNWARREADKTGAVPVGPAIVDVRAQFPGFAEAMRAAGWLEIGDGYIRFPRHETWISRSADQRIRAAERQRNKRERDAQPSPPIRSGSRETAQTDPRECPEPVSPAPPPRMLPRVTNGVTNGVTEGVTNTVTSGVTNRALRREKEEGRKEREEKKKEHSGCAAGAGTPANAAAAAGGPDFSPDLRGLTAQRLARKAGIARSSVPGTLIGEIVSYTAGHQSKRHEAAVWPEDAEDPIDRHRMISEAFDVADAEGMGTTPHAIAAFVIGVMESAINAGEYPTPRGPIKSAFFEPKRRKVTF